MAEVVCDNLPISIVDHRKDGDKLAAEMKPVGTICIDNVVSVSEVNSVSNSGKHIDEIQMVDRKIAKETKRAKISDNGLLSVDDRDNTDKCTNHVERLDTNETQEISSVDPVDTAPRPHDRHLVILDVGSTRESFYEIQTGSNKIAEETGSFDCSHNNDMVIDSVVTKYTNENYNDAHVVSEGGTNVGDNSKHAGEIPSNKTPEEIHIPNVTGSDLNVVENPIASGGHVALRDDHMECGEGHSISSKTAEEYNSGDKINTNTHIVKIPVAGVVDKNVSLQYDHMGYGPVDLNAIQIPLVQNQIRTKNQIIIAGHGILADNKLDKAAKEIQSWSPRSVTLHNEHVEEVPMSCDSDCGFQDECMGCSVGSIPDDGKAAHGADDIGSNIVAAMQKDIIVDDTHTEETPSCMVRVASEGDNYEVGHIRSTAVSIDEYIDAENSASLCQIKHAEADTKLEVVQTDKFYGDAKKYWETIPATIDGMLGGFSSISSTDIGGSARFLRQFIKSDGAKTNRHRALDCGAGIGRITKRLLLPLFQTVDMVELNQKFLNEARHYLGKDAHRVEHFFCCGLQDFSPEPGRYDVIWCQWVLGHLTDEHLVEFFQRCQGGLTENGLIVIKENITSGDVAELDQQDSSFTRNKQGWIDCIEKAGLYIVKEQKQIHFPQDIYEVLMFALKPCKS